MTAHVTALAVLGLFLLMLVDAVPASAEERRADDVSTDSLMTLVQQQAATISGLQAANAALLTRLSGLETAVQHHTSSIADVTARLNTQASFTAYMNHNAISDSPILFDAVVTNVGSHYNPQTGVFTAPVSGTYLFYAKILNHSGSDRVDWGIYQGTQLLCMNLIDQASFYNTASCLATVHLQKGNAVFVKRTNTGTTIEGGIWCSFSGQLVSVDP